MKFVLDANLVGDWFLPGQQTPATDAVFTAYRGYSIQFVAPETLGVEFAHALGKELRRGHLTREEARDIWADFNALPIELRPIGGLVGAAFDLATDHHAVVYDALYVALARAEEIQVLTSDGRMRNAFLALGSVTLVTDLQL
ncbi:MAG: type II toxin-antitoxin system VapC family toxin [Vicinamibacteria bacterium]